MKIKNSFLVLVFIVFGNSIYAQFPGCPAVDAGLDQALPCTQNCTDLVATPFHAGATNTYAVSSIPHAPPIPYNQPGGTAVSANTDDVWSPVINLPFPFCYYGNTYTTCKVGSNGAIDLGPAAGGGGQPWSFNVDCPSPGLNDDGDIFGVLHDIDPSVCGNIRWYLLGAAPCRIFVVSFDNICQFSCAGQQSRHMMVLYETTNAIDVYVESKPNCPGWNGGHSIIGIQNEAGTQGIAAPGRNTNPGSWAVNTPEAWRFTPNGAPIYTVDWYEGGTFLGTGNNINVCPAGANTTYTAQVTYTRCDGLLILETDDVSITYNPLGAPVVLASPESCDGANDGSVTINNAPGSGPYTVDIAGPSNQQFIEPNSLGGMATFNGLPDGNYTYTVTASNGCTYDGVFTIVAGPTCCTVAAVGTDLDCNADNSGTTTANPTGNAPFSYSWSGGGQTSQTATNLPAGNYTVTMTDDIGCIAIANLTITEPTALLANAVSDDMTCFGVCDGSVVVSAPAGGTAPYQYSINAGAFGGSGNFNGLCAGLYNVIVQDDNGCQLILAGNNVAEPTDVTLTETSTIPATCGQANGALTVTAGGGSPGYLYDIGGVQQVSNNFLGLVSGAYTVTVTDLNGCTETILVNVGNSAGPDPFVDAQSGVTCFGGLNGSVTIGANGGTAPYTFTLDAGLPQAGNTFQVNAGNHTVVVTDFNGCSGNVIFDIVQPTALTYVSANTAATCNGVCDGTITITANNATPPYMYSDDNGSTFQASNILIDLCAGNVNVVVQDANGCLANSLVVMAEPSLITSGSAFVEPSCNGLSDGEISFTPAGGTPGYTFSVDNGANFSGANPQLGIPAGIHDIVVQDANGCLFTDQINISEPPPFDFLFIANNPSNCGASDGSFEIIASNGLAPYAYSIDGGVTSQPGGFFGGLFSGLYELYVTDANGCAGQVFSALSDNVMITQVDFEFETTCKSSCDGFAQVSQINGAPPFTFTINTGNPIGQGSGDFGGLCAGQHFITIEDDGLCVAIEEVNIVEPDTVTFTAIITDVTCPLGADGQIDFGAVTGGDTGPYTYSIDGGANFQAGAVFPGLTSGGYDLVAMDGNGCIGAVTITVLEPTPWDVTVNPTNLTCFQNNTGFIQVVGGGASGPYTYNLGGTVSGTGVYAGLAAIDHFISVTDVNGCVFNTNQLLTEPAQLTEVNVLTNASCNATCNGEIDVTAAGGTAPYLYSSDGGVISQTLNILSGLCAGSYDLYVEDDNGCNITTNVAITEPIAVGGVLVMNPATCGLPNGELTIMGNGGTGAYQYSSDNGTSFQLGTSFLGLAPGNYDMVVEDANGCQYMEIIAVTSENSPQIIVVNTLDIDCNGVCIGEIDAQANGGSGALGFDIGAAIQPTGLFQNLCAGPYVLTVTDANGCTATQNVDLTEPAPLVHGTNNTDLLCFEDNSGVIDIDAIGGLSPYTYSFDNGATFGNDDVADYLAMGSHTIIVQDANGCQSSSVEVLAEPVELTVSGQVSNDVTCFDLCDGDAEVTVAGGTGAAAYVWSGGTPNGNQVDDLCAGGYIVDITDANGCTAQGVFSISQPAMVVITSISGVDVNCNGDCDGEIFINSAQAVDYSIDNGVNFQAGATFVGLCAGTYNVLVQNVNGCPQTTTIDINEPSPLVQSTIDDIQICYEGFGTLEAQASGGVGPYHYVWEVNDTVQYYAVQGLIAGQSFECIVYDFNGCPSLPQSGDVTIIAPPFQASVTPVMASICPGQSVTMTGDGQDGVPAYTYQWLTMGLDTLDSGTNPYIHFPAGSEIILMVGVDECDRFDTLAVDITVLGNPVPNFAATDPLGCSPLNTGFTNLTVQDMVGGTCNWDFGNGQTYVGCDDPSAIYTLPGCYDVTLEVTTVQGCYGLTTYNDIVCVAEDPIPGFYWEPAQPTILDPTVTFINTSSGGASYSYTFETGGTSSEESPTQVFETITEETEIQVCQFVTSASGCTADTCATITIYEDIIFYVPNAFTPDGDLYNESFLPVLTAGVDPYDYHLTIFNRWGEILFESYNLEVGWDGHFGGGGLVEDGVFIWQLEFGEKISDKKQTHRGHVTVLK
jgi:gliding motility-associated-like protein